MFDSGVPRLRYATSVAADEATVRIEQTGDLYDVPVTITVLYADGKSTEEVVQGVRVGHRCADQADRRGALGRLNQDGRGAWPTSSASGTRRFGVTLTIDRGDQPLAPRFGECSTTQKLGLGARRETANTIR